MYVIDLQKEGFKFSCSHFTIFSRKQAERLHGHNYYLSCQIEFLKVDRELGMAFDFNIVKPVIKDICDELDEFVLIPAGSPFLKIKTDARSIEVQFHEKRYVFPKEDVKLLPIVNVTSEELARYVSMKLVAKIKVPFERITIRVTETQGQSVSYVVSGGSKPRMSKRP